MKTHFEHEGPFVCGVQLMKIAINEKSYNKTKQKYNEIIKKYIKIKCP